MGSNKLVLTVLMSLSLFSLTACKQGSESSRTTIRKGNPSAQAKTNAETQRQKKLEEENRKKTGLNPDGTPATQSNTGTAENTPGAETDTGTAAKCDDLQSAATKNGWKLFSIQDKMNINKKISYYVLEKSIDNFTNPVIYFNRSSFQRISPEDLTKFKELYESHKIDPILMDMRGAGCSAGLPDLKTKTAELNEYGSKFAVHDAEQIRKSLLKDKPWKVLAHRSGGVVALRYAQLAPTALTSIHIADFAPMKSQTELMKIRLKQETDSWAKLMKEEDLTQDEVDKAIKNLGAEKDLFDAFASELSKKGQWKKIATDVKALAAGTKKSDELKEIVNQRKKQSDLNTASRILDHDSNKNLSACHEALQTDNKGTVNSCRLEKLVGHGSIAAIKNVLNHDPLKMDVIKANLTKHNVDYHLLSVKLSTLYPPNAYLEHLNAMGDLLDATHLSPPNLGSEAYPNDELLDTLK